MICLFFFSWFSCYRGWKKKLVHFYLLEMFYDLAIFLTTVGNRARLRAGRRGVSPRPVRSRVRLAVSYFIGFDCFFFSNPSEWLSSLSISSFRSKESKKKKSPHWITTFPSAGRCRARQHRKRRLPGFYRVFLFSSSRWPHHNKVTTRQVGDSGGGRSSGCPLRILLLFFSFLPHSSFYFSVPFFFCLVGGGFISFLLFFLLLLFFSLHRRPLQPASTCSVRFLPIQVALFLKKRPTVN